MAKIALITGSNKGIGYEVLRQLGKAGCHVILASRNTELGERAVKKLKEEDGVTAFFTKLDLTDQASIDASAKRIDQLFGKLDVLVNNAAIVVRGEDGLPSKTTANALQQAMETNFIGTFRVTLAMLPLLRKAQSASIVNVSSGLASLELSSSNHLPAEHRRLGYSASKTALNMLTCHLAFELREENISVNSADPGYTATDLTDYEGTQSVAEAAVGVVRLALQDKSGPTGRFINQFAKVAW